MVCSLSYWASHGGRFIWCSCSFASPLLRSRIGMKRGQGLQAVVWAGWEPLPSQEGRENLSVFKAAFTRAGNPGLIPPRRVGVKWGDPAGCHPGQAHLCLPSFCRFPRLSEDSRGAAILRVLPTSLLRPLVLVSSRRSPRSCSCVCQDAASVVTPTHDPASISGNPDKGQFWLVKTPGQE